MPRRYEPHGQVGRPAVENPGLCPPVGTPEPPGGNLGWLMGWPVAISEEVVVEDGLDEDHHPLDNSVLVDE